MGFGHRANVACCRREGGWRPIVIVSGGGAVHQQLLFVAIVRRQEIIYRIHRHPKLIPTRLPPRPRINVSMKMSL
jgi:hypothetical protein